MHIPGFILAYVIAYGYCITDEKFLHKTLLQGYNRNVVPKSFTSGPLNVYVEAFLMEIIEIHKTNNYMVSSVFFDNTWNDELLVWNDTDFGDTDTIRLPVDKVWRPDIVIMNGMDSRKGIPDQQETVKVRYDGKVTWWPWGKLKTRCHVNVVKYPFDSQTCDIVLQP